MDEFETIILEIEEPENYAIMYLNRPDQFNALNFQLAEDFCSVLEKIFFQKKKLKPDEINKIIESAIDIFFERALF